MEDELLVALDGSKGSLRAVEPVAALARRLGGAVSGVCVDHAGVQPFGDHAWLERELAPEGVEVRRRLVVSSTDVAGALLRVTAGIPGSVLCMAARGRPAVGGAVLGSVSSAVVRRSPAPVLLVGPACEVPVRFDWVDLSFPAAGLSSEVHAIARRWAVRLGAEICVVPEEQEGPSDAALLVVVAMPLHLPKRPLGRANALVRVARQPVLVIGPAVTFGSGHPVRAGV